MYRAIITPTENIHTIDLPEEFFGKKVEVTIVELSEPAIKKNNSHPIRKSQWMSCSPLLEAFLTFRPLKKFGIKHGLANGDL